LLHPRADERNELADEKKAIIPVLQSAEYKLKTFKVIEYYSATI
jgi:hypothetical protein